MSSRPLHRPAQGRPQDRTGLGDQGEPAPVLGLQAPRMGRTPRKRWYFWASHSRLVPVIEAARTLKRHLHGLRAYPLSNAGAEGLNSRIRRSGSPPARTATARTSDRHLLPPRRPCTLPRNSLHSRMSLLLGHHLFSGSCRLTQDLDLVLEITDPLVSISQRRELRRNRRGCLQTAGDQVPGLPGIQTRRSDSATSRTDRPDTTRSRARRRNSEG